MIKNKIAYLSAVDFEFESTKSQLKELGGYVWVSSDKNNGNLNVTNLEGFNTLILSPDAYEYYNDRFFDSLPNLKYVTTVTSGHEYIDKLSAKSHGVIVSNCPGANAQSVAEHVFGMFLALTKRIVQFDRDIRSNGVYKYDGYVGNEMYKKTLGIIGYGHIGKRVAKIGSAFGMEVLTYTRSPDQKLKHRVKFVTLIKLLKNSDYIVICAPLNSKTHNLVNSKTLSKIKNGCYLVNVSRDEIINVPDLCKSLYSKNLSGFALDGTAYKPIDKRLLKYPNVIVNAHNGFNTVEANERVENMAVANIRSFVKGNLKNVVN